MISGGLIAIAVLIFLWLTSANPYLLENPTWLFNKPSNEAIIQSLPSVKNINYRPLRTLLQEKRWKDADQETQKALANILSLSRVRATSAERYMLSVERKNRATLIQKIPCTDLLTIDRLWVNFSNGLFGFSVQKQIVENDNKLLSSDFKEKFERIPETMGRGRSTVSDPLPAGYYPSPIEVIIDFEANTYREIAKRVGRCNI